MKLLFAVLVLFALSICACQSSAVKNDNVSTTPTHAENKTNNLTASNSSPSNDPSKVEQTKQSEMVAQNDKFRSAPEDFKQIDFKNFSYPYKFWNGKRINIALTDGEYEYEFSDDKGWFSGADAYFVDLTNDGHQEAIVILWHVTCGGSCDGGAGLFYVYTAHQNKLKSLWQYETGSLGYGCGVKSFTVRKRKIVLELFGRCLKERDETPDIGKFLVKGTTRLTFGFHGGKFVREEREFISAPERDVKNYQPEISIDE